ncbi:MAG: hypothetical protein P8X79_13095 [Reinekea sp.]
MASRIQVNIDSTPDALGTLRLRTIQNHHVLDQNITSLRGQLDNARHIPTILS